ncbi:hypothetical protein ES703_65226 [subsurface metagenome]
MALPKGLIILWYGTIGNIPTGWILCDGNNDTPDLRDKFLVGAGLTYAVGTAGGAVNHDHTFTSDGHQHGAAVGTDIAEGVNIHFLTDTKTDTGTTDNGSSLPPYHALAYIMKT